MTGDPQERGEGPGGISEPNCPRCGKPVVTDFATWMVESDGELEEICRCAAASRQDMSEEIKDGIEWVACGDYDKEPFCARCGSSCEFVTCWYCGGDPEALGSTCIDDLCHGGECIHGESGFIRCDWCRGEGGSYHCVSSPEWCEANPMQGREQIPSTAMNPEAWRDVL